jgi:hypothetical protein
MKSYLHQRLTKSSQVWTIDPYQNIWVACYIYLENASLYWLSSDCAHYYHVLLVQFAKEEVYTL